MYLIISIILIALTVVFTYNSKLAELRKNKPDFFNFGLTLVATFVGVLFAIELTNRAEFKSEEDNVIKILDATSIVLSNQSETLGIIYEIAETIDSTENNFSLTRFIKANRMITPRLFEGLITYEKVARHLSSYGIQKYSSSFENFNRFHEKLYVDTLNDFILSDLRVMIGNIDFAINILEIERAQIIERLGDEEIQNRYKEIEDEDDMSLEELKELIRNKKLFTNENKKD